MESILNTIVSLPPEVGIFLLSMLPISELRGAIPWGIIAGQVPVWKAYPIAVIGNMIPVLPLIWFLEPIQHFLRRYRYFDRFFRWVFERTKKRGAVVEKYETLGLMVFVAIPLPVTGAWTGTVAALIFGIKPHLALIAITLGVMIAGVIVSTLTLMGVIGGVIAAVILLGLAVKSLYNRI